MTKKDIQIEKRLTTLEVELGEIKNNHLVHIATDIKEVKDILVAHIKDEATQIANIKLGMPPWMATIGVICSSVFTGLIVWFLTHRGGI